MRKTSHYCLLFKGLRMTTKQIETLLQSGMLLTTGRLPGYRQGQQEELNAELTPTQPSLTFLIQASPASWSSLLVELRALKRAAMIFSLD